MNEVWTRDLAALPYREAKRRLLLAFDDIYFAEVVLRSAGNFSEAARRAGVDKANLRRKLRRVYAAGGHP